ncbi:MAG TPA: threonine synthase [Gemmatimonadales bacterium]|nr:threonine synthase [Gemmatimonadales bacterium]
MDWMLSCAACGATDRPDGLKTVCHCGQPWLVRYPDRTWSRLTPDALGSGPGMWRYRAFLPLTESESPVSLGEGTTPLLAIPRAGADLGAGHLWVKDEGVNPTGSFKARGLAAAITRASLAGAKRFTLPTAGNAGVAASAYAARAGLPVRVYAPDSTPKTILSQIRWFGGDLVLLPGHIGDCGKASRQFAAEHSAVDLSTLREPYRIEGKKTLGLEIAEQLGWTLPDVILYPTGGGTGLIGMWKAFRELIDAGWVAGPAPRLFSVQSDGCAPVVRAFAAGKTSAEPWADPWTVASGLRVPGPLGDRLMLGALRETKGGAIAVSDAELSEAAARFSRLEGLDLSPEGGATFAALRHLLATGQVSPDERIVLFNTGAGWLYRGA